MKSVVRARLTTAQLTLRPWAREDAPSLKAAIDENLDHLRPWVPWADREPSTLEEVIARVERDAGRFWRNEEWLYALVERAGGSLVGGAGLYPRVGPGALEIGYWVHRDWTRRGFATEAAGVLTVEALRQDEIDRVEMHVDPRNASSAAIPARLGYRRLRTERCPPRVADGPSQEIVVWGITRSELPADVAALHPTGLAG